MLLLIPLTILLVALAVAWLFGWLARGRGHNVHWTLGATGVALLFVLPLAYEASIFNSSCYAVDGTASSCTLEERLWQSFISGFGFTTPPALMWIAVFLISARSGQAT
jgi:hypothetical protein